MTKCNKQWLVSTTWHVFPRLATVAHFFFELWLAHRVLISLCLVTCDIFGFGFNISHFKNHSIRKVINLSNITVDTIRYETMSPAGGTKLLHAEALLREF